MHPAAIDIDRLLASCDIQRTRASGPGGQHRNKVETAIVITHRATGIRGEASERRSQEQNRRQAIQRLRVNLALNIRRPPKVQVSELWRRRSQAGRIRVNVEHEDFPAVLAECLDWIDARGDVAAIRALGVSRSQLIRFLKLEPRALQSVNAARVAQGLHPFR